MNEFFASEAERYLDRLEALLAGETIDAEELFRLARGVRGSAHMTGSDTIARVAERLENAAVAVLQNHVAWSEETRQLSLQTVGDLRLLLRALNRWGPEEEKRVRTAIERWQEAEPAAEPGTPAPRAQPAEERRPPALRPYWGSGTSGERALRDALALRPLLEEMLARRGEPDAELQSIVDELFELIRVGLQPARDVSAA